MIYYKKQSVGGNIMSNAAIRQVMANVEASINMEGLTVSNQCKELCKKILNKEISFEEYLKMVVANGTEE